MVCTSSVAMSARSSMNPTRVDSMDAAFLDDGSPKALDSASAAVPKEASDTAKSHSVAQAAKMLPPPRKHAGDFQTKKNTRRGSDRAMSHAVKQRMRELDATGWRPEEEELMSILADDDYDAVDLVSCSEDGDDDDVIRRQEENFLLSIADLDDKTEAMSGAVAAHDDMSVIGPGDIDFSLHTTYAQLLDAAQPDAMLSRNCPSSPQRPVAKNDIGSRRVRFEETTEDLSDDPSSISDDDQRIHDFPDLFGDDHGLATTFRLADALHKPDDGSDTGSCWDFDGDEVDGDDGDEDDGSGLSCTSIDDSDLDEGETTEEDEFPHPSTILKGPMKRPAQAPPTSTSRSSKARRTESGSNKSSSTNRLPVAGKFKLDPNRPVLLIDGAGRTQRNMFFPARIQTEADKKCWQRLHSIYSSCHGSPRTSVQLSPDQELECDESMAAVSEADSASINTFFDNHGSLRTNQVIGPPEAFMPFTSIDATGSIAADNDSMMSQSDMDDTDYLSLINLDDDSEDGSDTEADDTKNNSDTTDTHQEWATKSNFPHLSEKGSRGGGGDLLSHLDRNRGLVGSFRRNQQLAKHIGSLASHPSLRASTLEMNAMQNGRRAAANTPITPLRKTQAWKAGVSRKPPGQSPLSKMVARKRLPPRGSFGLRR